MSTQNQWYMDDDGSHVFEIQGTRIWIETRPWYCDRGHYRAQVEGLADVDAADSFPRYFMDLDRAKMEMEEWLKWKLTCQQRQAQENRHAG